MKDLLNFTKEELKSELEAREETAEDKAAKERGKMVRRVLNVRNGLLSLMKHSRSSCGGAYSCNEDYHPKHGVAYCSLCALRDLHDRDDVEVMIDVRLTKVSK